MTSELRSMISATEQIQVAIFVICVGEKDGRRRTFELKNWPVWIRVPD